MGARLRKLLLFGALAGIVGFLLLDKPAPAPKTVAITKTDGAAPRASAPADPLQIPDQRELARTRGELFRGHSPSPSPKSRRRHHPSRRRCLIASPARC